VIVFRFVYYLLPLLLGSGVFGIAEATRMRRVLGEAASGLLRIADPLAPIAFGVLAFLCGVVLLASSATPAIPWRLEITAGLVPHAVIEFSHFTGSLIGTTLLLLGQGLARRLAGAWLMSAVLLALGIVVSLLKGLEMEEAAILAVVLAMLLPCRPVFYRHFHADRRAIFTGMDRGGGGCAWRVGLARALRLQACRIQQ
jgi:phosphatidylglycerol lysyltransferase